jgi:hypothetical protein
MTMQLTSETPLGGDDSVPRLAAGGRERLQPAGDRLWRVLDRQGHVIGHIESFLHPLGVRFRAKRYQSSTARFVEFGDFWSADDAVGCLRYSA